MKYILMKVIHRESVKRGYIFVEKRDSKERLGGLAMEKDGMETETLLGAAGQGREKPGSWLEITITTTPEAAEMVGEVLIESGCGGVIYHDPFISLESPEGGDVIIPERLCQTDLPYKVSGYLPLRSGVNEVVEQIKARLQTVARELPLGEGTLEFKEVREEDWANTWKAYFKPEIVGRIMILPSWLEEEGKEAGRVVVKIDPGMAFGTGAHPSTRLTLLLLQETINGGETVYDIGAGSGILAISAVKLGAGRVLAVDIDPVAVETARENVDRNGVGKEVTVIRGDLLNGLSTEADLIIANIIAEVITRITPGVSGLLREKGVFITSGIICSKAGLVKEELVQAGFRIEKELEETGWVAFMARK